MSNDNPGLGATPAPGIYPGVEEHVYRSWRAVSQSSLKPLDRSPAHARHEAITPRESETFDLGSAIHACILEPDELETRFSVRPPGIDGRTKEGKVLMAEWKAEAEGKVLVPQRDAWETLLGIRDTVLEHDHALDLLTCQGHTELSIVWEDPDLGVLCKARADRFCEPTVGACSGWPTLVDVKSTQDGSVRGFGKSMVNFDYGVQAASYKRGMETLSPGFDVRFLFLCVEKAAPYGVSIFEPDIVWMDYGLRRYLGWLEQWKKCEKEERWPGYPDDVQVIEAPEWISKRLEYAA